MSEPFLAEIRIVGFNFAPRGHALCDGQILPINQNQALYSLLGTTYGGDGRSTFGLPDLRGRTPIHKGTPQGGNQNFSLGEKLGTENETLVAATTPQHTHPFNVANANATLQRVENADPSVTTKSVLAKANIDLYRAPGNAVALSPQAITSVGGSQGHTNLQPTLVINYVIALQGLFPSRN
jgi:microcystin-dependent protein